MHAITIFKKEAINLKQSCGDIWEGLAGEKRREKCCNNIINLKFFSMLKKKSNLEKKEGNNSCEIVLAFCPYGEIPDTMYLSSKKRFI